MRTYHYGSVVQSCTVVMLSLLATSCAQKPRFAEISYSALTSTQVGTGSVHLKIIDTSGNIAPCNPIRIKGNCLKEPIEPFSYPQEIPQTTIEPMTGEYDFKAVPVCQVLKLELGVSCANYNQDPIRQCDDQVFSLPITVKESQCTNVTVKLPCKKCNRSFS
jgi:hypothetical protein